MTLTDKVREMTRRARRGSSLDPSVQADLDWRRHGIDLPDGLEITWLGTAAFKLSCGETTLVIDPYVSRRSLGSALRQRPMIPDRERVDRLIGSADAVLVGHTHFDHAVDVPHLAARGATIYGSSSAERLLGLHGRENRAVVVEPHRPYEIGPFTVTFVPSRHSKLLLGQWVPADGELTCEHLDDLAMGAYRCGQVWGIHIALGDWSLYHQGSADVIEDEVRHSDIDVFLCGIAGRCYAPGYTERILRLLSPKLVVPHHHDDFFRPVEDPMDFSLNVHLASFCEDVETAAPDLPVRTMQPLEPVSSS